MVFTDRNVLVCDKIVKLSIVTNNSALHKDTVLDLIKYVFEDIIRLGCKFAILGSGEKIYEDFFSEMHYRYPDRVGLTIGFVPELSKKIYAGADMFLMPSQSEPCGLAQIETFLSVIR